MMTLDISKDLKIIFSPLHGTANIPVRRVLTECGYEQLHVVEEQCTFDPNFSTVKSPNPEETSAFEMAIQMAKEIDADIAMATDPDADRVGLTVKNSEGEYVLLKGNQTGAILIHYILSQKKAHGTLPAKVYIGVISDNIQLADEQVTHIKVDILTRINKIIA